MTQDPTIPVPSLSTGDVVVVASPVDRATNDRLVARIAQIRGVDAVRVERVDQGESLLRVHLSRPTALAGELRAALGAEIARCALVDGHLELRLVAPGARAMASGVRRTTTSGAERPHAPAGPEPSTATAPRPAAFAGQAARVAMTDALNGLPDISIVTFDRELRFNGVAGLAHERFGFRAEHLLGRHARSVVREATWPVLEPGYIGALEGRSSVIRVPGLEAGAQFEASFSPVVAGSQVIGGKVVTRDVSAAHLGDATVAELHAVLDITFDSSPMPQALLSPAGRWLRVNDALADLLGRPAAELVGLGLFDVTSPDDLPGESALIAAMHRGEHDHYELRKRFVRPDGSTVPVLVRTTNVRAPDGTPQGLVLQVLVDAG